MSASRHAPRTATDPEAAPSTATNGVASRFTRIAESIDVEPFLAELEAASDLWLADTSRQRKVRCQRDTLNIFLRVARKPLPPGATNANDVHESRTARFAARFPHALRFCERTAALQDGELGRATFVSLQPQGWVRPHVDAGAYYRIRDRFHLVLRSPGGSPLTCGDEAVVMRAGELWAFDNKTRHDARNPTGEPRVHLIFDVLPANGRGYYVLPPAD